MEFETLTNIYNALLQVETKGQSTMIMGACLNTLKTMINNSIATTTSTETEPIEE
ncbi:hypothetical protein AALA22_08785 [Anaerovoracaceae bacterium 41-7]